MSTFNKFEVVCATQLEGSVGMQFWGVTKNGHLLSNLQKDVYASWDENWDKWPMPKSPQNIKALAAAPARNGAMSLWALTTDGVLHCRSQKTAGGVWGEWSDPDTGWLPNPKSPNPKPPKLKCLCVGLMGFRQGWSPHGRSFFGFGEDDGQLWVTYEDLVGKEYVWVPWYVWADNNSEGPPRAVRTEGGVPKNITALTTAAAGDIPASLTSLWAVTEEKGKPNVLHCISQFPNPKGEDKDPGWGPWVHGWWDAPDLVGICASRQGGKFGRAIWGIGNDGQLYWTYENQRSGGDWEKVGGRWPGFRVAGKPPQGITSLCAGQSRGRVTLWALAQDNLVHSATQTTADNDWENWDVGPTRLPSAPKQKIINSVVKILSKNSGYDGVTYFRSSGNFKLLQTPAVWGQGASPKMPSDACKDFLQEIENTIGSAQNQLDITTLFNIESKTGFPDGGFQRAIARGLEKIGTNKYNPVVRILFGLPVVNQTLFLSLLKKFAGGVITLVYHLMKDPNNKSYQKDLVTQMQNWLKSTTKNIDINYPIYMAFSQASQTSHNHAKMIVADDSRVITGGHNLWASDYLTGDGNRVHDISCLITGPAAKAARQFADKLWTKRLALTCWKKPNFVTDSPPSAKPAEPSGSGNMLALGKLGKGWGKFNITSNASKTARIIALCSANSTIRISQQTLGGPINILGLDFYTCLALLRAVQADVKVQILVSQDATALNPYAGFAPEVRNELVGMYKDDLLTKVQRYRAAPSRNNLDVWANLSLTSANWEAASLKQLPKDSEWVRKLKKNLQISRSYSSANVPVYNHSKIYIVDERCFYIGSDNFYVSMTDPGLQEFGYLIEDHAQTLSFIDNYWKNAWGNAQLLRVP
jgi:phosphatidylserine/phosphatidylglycerophosphate/cardiolipin synthase-like enzyme